MSRRARGALTALVIAAAGILPAVLLYTPTLGSGFDYDDYHFVRPYSADDVRAAFVGPWDAAGIELAYYRPLTIALFAARFAWFGVNSAAYHAASLTLFALAACLAGWVAWSLTGRRAAGAITAAAFAVHPAMPYALVAWVTNQMHLAETIVVLTALAWWSLVRARPWPWWVPLWPLASAAFLLKEDGIMLLPAIAALHWLRRRLVEPALAPPPLAWSAGSAALVVALLAIRAAALDGAAGRRLPDTTHAITNYVAGLNHVLRLVPADRPWQLVASVFATALPIAGGAAAGRSSPGVRFGIAAGVLMVLAFDLPFVFVTKNEQLHLVAAGAALLLGSCAVALVDALRARSLRLAAWLVVAGGLTACAAVGRNIAADFSPYGPIVLAHDRIVEGWSAVPEEIRGYLASKRRAEAPRPDPNLARVLSSVAFGVHPGERSPAGVPYRWMSSARATILVTRDARSVVIPLRHEIGAFREPADAIITLDDRELDRISFTGDEWRYSTLALPASDGFRLFGMHVVTVTLRRAWVPSAVIPGSTDSRTLGLQVGELELR